MPCALRYIEHNNTSVGLNHTLPENPRQQMVTGTSPHKNAARLFGLPPSPFNDRLVYSLLKLAEAAHAKRRCISQEPATPHASPPPPPPKPKATPPGLDVLAEPLVSTLVGLACIGSNSAFDALSVLRLLDRRFHSFVTSHFTTPHLSGLSRSRSIPFDVFGPMQLQHAWIKLNPGQSIPNVGWSMFRAFDDSILPAARLAGKKRSSEELDRDDREFVILVVDP